MYKHIIVSTPFRPSSGVRSACAVAALVASFAVNLPARAQSDYPNRPVHLIVPYGPGGVADVNMRLVADKLSDRLKQRFVVENRPGAGSIVASKAVATAAPDGYTLLMTGNNTGKRYIGSAYGDQGIWSLNPSASSSSRYANNPASDVTTDPRNCSIRRRSKSSLRTPSFDSPVGCAMTASLRAARHRA